MKTALIVGKKFSGLNEALKSLGYDYITLRDVKTSKLDPSKKYKKLVLCDFSNFDTIKRSLDSLKTKPDFVMVTYESYVLPAAYIAEYFKFPGLPIKSAEACSDKYLMRQLFSRAPKKISPDFAEAKSWDDVLKFAKNHSFPLILKPANLSKSLLVTKSKDLDELEKNYHKTVEKIGQVYRKYAPDREPKIIVEEFLEGSVYSVDAFVDSEGTPHVIDGIVDYQTGYEIGYDDNFHYSRLLPSKLSKKDQEALIECADLGCRALGMKNSPAHIEIIMTKDGPRIVEIGARNGGYRERMYKMANDIDITKNAIMIACGEKPDIRIAKREPVAVLELFPKEPGEFAGLENIDKLKTLPSLEYLSIKAKEGEFAGKSSDGYKAAAIIILHNSDKKQFEKDLEYVNNHVYVKTN